MPQVQFRFEGYLIRETAGWTLGTPPRYFKAQRGNMLTTETFENALDLLELGYTFPSITEETGITTEDAEAVHVAWFNGRSEQVSRELQLAGVLELAAARLRSGQGWDEGTTGDVLARNRQFLQSLTVNRIRKSPCRRHRPIPVQTISPSQQAAMNKSSSVAHPGIRGS